MELYVPVAEAETENPVSEIAKDGKETVEHFKESGINYYHAIFKQPH